MLRDVFSFKEKWASAFGQRTIFSCDVHQLCRADAVTKLIKSRLYAKASIIELIKLIEDIDQKIEQRCDLTASMGPCKQIIHSPLLR